MFHQKLNCIQMLDLYQNCADWFLFQIAITFENGTDSAQSIDHTGDHIFATEWTDASQ